MTTDEDIGHGWLFLLKNLSYRKELMASSVPATRKGAVNCAVWKV